MKDFKKNDRFGGNGGRNKFGGRGFGGGKPSFGGRGRKEVTMHSAVCGDCGKKCEVPFRPSGDKPVFCSSCFGSKNEGFERGNNRGGDKFKRSERRDFEGNRDSQKRSPVDNSTGINDLKRQMELLTIKLDTLTRTLEKFDFSKKEEISKPIETEKKAVAKKKTVKENKKVSKAKKAK